MIIRCSFQNSVIFSPIFIIKTGKLTVPLMETIMVPIREPKRRPADMVNGIAGIARIQQRMGNFKSVSANNNYYWTKQSWGCWIQKTQNPKMKIKCSQRYIGLLISSVFSLIYAHAHTCTITSILACDVAHKESPPPPFQIDNRSKNKIKIKINCLACT